MAREAARPSRQVRRAQERRKPPTRKTLQKQPTRKTLRVEHFVFALLIAAGSIAYHNALRGPFVLDDIPAITWNPTIRTLWPPSTVLSPPPHSAATGRPIVNLSLALNYAVSGRNAVSYHVFNLAIHILSALVLFAIILRTLGSPGLRSRHGDRAIVIATAAALLWVVHPLTSESVNYTIQRTELLMGLFFLLTLYCAIRAFEPPERRGWYVPGLAAFALGLGSKEVIVVAPAVVFVYGWMFFSTSLRNAFRRHWPLYAGFAAVLLLYTLLIGTRLRRAFAGFSGRAITPWNYAMTQAGVIVHYLRLALWPHPLVADYDGWPIATSVTSVLPPLVVVVTLLALTFWGLARRQKLALLGVWFFVILAPTSSVRPMPTEVAAERRMYLPLAAVVLLVVLAGQAVLQRLGAPRAAGAVIVVALAAILALVTVRRNEDYRTILGFWSDVIAKRPDNPRAHGALGNYLFKQGRKAEALEQLAEAVRIQPDNAYAQYRLGIVLASQGRTEEATARYREAIRIDPDNVYAHYNLARVLIAQGLTIEATEHLETAVRLQPAFPQARRTLDDLRSRLSQ